ncbi:MAG: hypothetical protein L3J32_11930 [Rhizobiaceae bacterium]|nr:hypothetical protein [Rhizobiaceae bacterium]
MAADIESLIRQALARQNGFDPQVRSKIYQSSRNALAKMIAKSGVIPPDVIEARNHLLEETISKIEHEFTDEVSVSEVELEPQSILEPSNPAPIEPEQQTAPPISIADTNAPVAPSVHEPEITTDTRQPEFDDINPGNHAPEAVVNIERQPSKLDPGQQYASPTPQYARPRPKPIRYIVWIIAITILAIIGWIAYMIATEFLVTPKSKPLSQQTSQNLDGSDAGTFVTILEPGQPGALITSDNGTAEIINNSTHPAIRIMSVRQTETRVTQAEPLLLELAPGILKDIAGKKVTVEIMAKSGDTTPATFAVTCDFGELGECGRKRFRIGLQPEAVVFSIQISGDYQEGQRAFLAINTDVTSAAALSGNGAKIDILYARIKTGNGK